MDDYLTILEGDALEQLKRLPFESVHCCVTSPPYWGLRDYSTNGQLGLEKTPDEYVAKMVEIFREVRRVLRKDGTLWLNLGDSYVSTAPGTKNSPAIITGSGAEERARMRPEIPNGLKPKDLCGIPWRVAFALQADGWWLRSDIIWAKPNPMPESVTDRPTKSHEYLFLLSKSANYFYDAEAIREQVKPSQDGSMRAIARDRSGPVDIGNGAHMAERTYDRICGANKRSVWTVATTSYPEAHFATYPPDLIKPCIMAGTSAKGCCAKCGAPWERQIKEGDLVSTYPGLKAATQDTMKTNGDFTIPRSRVGEGRTAMPRRERETIGWQPTCKCEAETAPCTVLDPFAGSGTTGAVAIELGRRAILIELNPKYVQLIRDRCNITPGLALA